MLESKVKLLVPYQESWVDDFNNIKHVLVEANPDLAIQVEHVGSTSIPDLMAKPIVDIDLVYQSAGDFKKIKSNLEGMGYYHNGDQGISGREVFKRNPANHFKILDTITHHLYVCHSDSDELKKHLKFRDALRHNQHLRKEYQELKLALAEKADQDKKTYAALKERKAYSFFAAVLETN